jgi:hypothetical protein
MNSRWQEIERIYGAAADLPPERQEAFVRAQTTGHPELAAEILELLAAGDPTEQLPRHQVDLQDLLEAFTTNFLTGRALGPYDVGDLLGSGGMGLVFRATDRRNANTVAIKVLPPDQTRHPDRVKRLLREAEALAKLHHPSIVRILDAGAEGQLHYLVMELLEGETLRERLGAGPLSVDEVRALGVSIAGALAEAHAAGVTHRDLKPENIMLTAAGVKLLDFGIAHLDDGDNPRRTTLREALSGTVAYLAPEQIEGEPAKPASDLFALGVVLFEASTGRHPFQRANPVATAAAIVRDQPPLRLVPPRLRLVVGGCLQKKAARRYSSAAEVRSYLAGTIKLAKLGAKAKWTRAIAATVAAAAVIILCFIAWRAAPSKHDPLILAGPGDFDSPNISPDGRWVAYVSHSHIWVQPAGAGQRAVQVSFQTGKDGWPSLSTDGSSVVYEHTGGGPDGIYRARLSDGKNSGAAEEFLLPGFRPRFSPNGRKIAFESSPISANDPESVQPQIRVVPSDGPFTSPVTLQLADGYIFPGWFWEASGGDTSLLVGVIYRRSHAAGLFRVDASGGPAERIYDRALRATESANCGVRPSGTVVAVTKPGDLVDVSRRGETILAQTLKTSSQRATGCQVLPGGTVAAFLDHFRRDIWEVSDASNRNAPAARPLGLATGYAVSASFDGRWLGWLDPTDTPMRAMLRDARGVDVELGRAVNWAPKLAADGTAILIEHLGAEGGDKEIISLPSRKLTRKLDVDSIVWDVSNGARWLLRVGTPSLPRSIGAFNTQTGVLNTILLDPKLNLYLAELSADERWVVFTTEAAGQPARIWVAPFNPDRLIPREQWIEIGLGDYPAWNPAGNRIYYLALEQDRILSVGFDARLKKRAGEPSLVFQFAPGWGLRGLPGGGFRIAVTPDRVLFNLAQRESIVEVLR